MLSVFAPLAGIVFIGSCTSDDPASRVAAMNDSNIRRLANLYVAHQTRHGGSGPKDEQAFKEFIRKGIARHRLEMMLVDPEKLEDLFRSERDGKPFVIRYGVSGGLTTTEPVVFEQEGRDGKRKVAFTNGPVEEVDNARYEQLLKGGK